MAERFWESLRLGFMQLRSDCAIEPPLKPQGGMNAVWSAYPPPGEWNFEHFKRKDGYGVERRFIWHVLSATARLKFIGDEQEALSFWLHKVRQDAPDAYLQIQRGVDSDGAGIVWVVEIPDICGLSAEYCRKCEADESVKSTLAQEITEAPTQLPDLPPKFQDAFEARRAKAELAYANRAERLPHHSDVSESIHRIKLRQDVFFAYCKEARNACRAGSMTLAQARKATDAALPFICDSYLVRDHGNCSAEAKSVFRVHFTRGITDDPQWKQHLTELVVLAEGISRAAPRASVGEGKGSSGSSVRLSRKGDQALLAGKELVTLKTAEAYLGISERQRQSLMQNETLVVKGKGHNRKITTESLLEYLPAEKPK